MSDHAILLEIFLEIDEAIQRIKWRFAEISSPEDFIKDRQGLDRLDGISMMLIAIGENIKRLSEIMNGKLEECYPEIDWSSVKGLRNILAHNYFSIDAEEVYHVCLHYLTPLQKTLTKIRHEIR